MSKASKIRAARINSASTPPKIENRNKTSKPKGIEAEKNAIADSTKSLVESYGFIEDMADFNQELIIASAIGNYGKDSHYLPQEFNSGYQSVSGVEKNPEYDKPGLKRVSEGVVVEQNLKTGKIKKVKDKNYHKG